MNWIVSDSKLLLLPRKSPSSSLRNSESWYRLYHTVLQSFALEQQKHMQHHLACASLPNSCDPVMKFAGAEKKSCLWWALDCAWGNPHCWVLKHIERLMCRIIHCSLFSLMAQSMRAWFRACSQLDSKQKCTTHTVYSNLHHCQGRSRSMFSSTLQCVSVSISQVLNQGGFYLLSASIQCACLWCLLLSTFLAVIPIRLQQEDCSACAAYRGSGRNVFVPLTGQTISASGWKQLAEQW